jgi:hypothetical protein
VASGYAVALQRTFSGICPSVTFTILLETVMFSGGSENYRILFTWNVYEYPYIGFMVLTAVVMKSTFFWLCLLSAFVLVSYSAYSSTLKMEAICSSETSVDFQRATRRYIPEDSTLHPYIGLTISAVH